MKRLDFTLDNIPYIEEGISLALGYFDGLHLGHISLIEQSKKSKFKSALLTFKMDNINLKRDTFLTTLSDREKILNQIGIDYMLVINFDENLMKLTPAEFIENILRKLNVKEVVLGSDYTFGYKKSGTKETLLNYDYKFYDVKVVNDVIYENYKVSTTLLINLLKEGKIELVNKLLTRNYSVKGSIKKGLSNGKTISYPTANVKLNGKYVLPKNGVYFTYTIVNGKRYKSMSNIGIHPTISPLDDSILETHIFDFNEDIYNVDIEIEFISYIRDEKKFSSLDELKQQLISDEKLIRDIKI